MTEQSRSKYIDTWRAIAVSLVIIYHVGQNIHIAAILSKFNASFLTSYGFLGVLIFFFISGHVVSRTCLHEIKSTGSFSILGFYIRRVYRIVPPLLIYLSACVLLGYAGIIDFAVHEFFGAALYLCNSDQQILPCGWNSGHTWSLAFEEQFYMLFPMVFAAIELGRRISPIIVLPLCLAIVPLLLPVPWVGRVGFVAIYALFGLGYFFSKNESQVIAQLNRAPLALFLIATTLTFFPVVIFESAALVKYYKFVYIFSIPVMVLTSSVISGFGRAFFDSTVLAYLGQISYSIYLWQQLVTSKSFHESQISIQIGAVVLVVAGSALSFHFLEKHFIAWGRLRAKSLKRVELPAQDGPLQRL